MNVKIISNDENNGKIGTVEKQWRDGSYSVYIAGDEDAKNFNATELRLTGENAATEKQIDYIVLLGGEPAPYTKQDASKLIDSLKPSCHYCGMPATGHGFFGEPACSECGG